MGSGNSTPAKVTPTNPIVKQLFNAAETQIKNKDVQNAIASYEKAETLTTDEKVKQYIHYQLSTLKDDNIITSTTSMESPSKKIQKSQEITNKFDQLFEAFKTNVASPATYNDAVENVNIIIQMDPRQVISIGTYFNNLMSKSYNP